MPNKYFWSALFWTIIVTTLCLVSNDSLKGLSTFKLPNKDKYLHFIFYFIFTVLWYLYIRIKNNDRGTSKTRLMVFCIAVGYGIFIECAQKLFTNDRSADLLDVLANTGGSATAVLTLWLLSKNIKTQY